MICPHCNEVTSTKYFKDGVGQCSECDKIIQYEEPSNPDVDEKLKLIIQFDKKLRLLMEGEVSYESEQQKEKAVLCKLIPYGFTLEQIDYVLTNKIVTEVWGQAKPEYKQDLYEETSVFINNLPKSALAEYLAIKIKQISIYSNKEDSLIKIIAEQGCIDLNKDTLLNPNQFKTMYYVLSGGTMLQPVKIEVWAKIITYWTKRYGKVLDVEASTEENMVKERVLEEIESFLLVDEIKQSIFFGRAFKEENNVLIPSSSIETIFRKYKFNMKLTKLAIVLEDYLSKKSEPKRVQGKLIRFWFFDSSKLNLAKPLEQKEVIEE
jgi:sporulation protein YlmC with PRC-barrel domain